MKNRCKTSLKLVFNENGKGATLEQKWSALDEGHGLESAERIILELTKLSDYKWLFPLIRPYFAEKYCDRCSIKSDCDKQEPEQPFPYCFKV